MRDGRASTGAAALAIVLAFALAGCDGWDEADASATRAADEPSDGPEGTEATTAGTTDAAPVGTAPTTLAFDGEEHPVTRIECLATDHMWRLVAQLDTGEPAGGRVMVTDSDEYDSPRVQLMLRDRERGVQVAWASSTSPGLRVEHGEDGVARGTVELAQEDYDGIEPRGPASLELDLSCDDETG